MFAAHVSPGLLGTQRVVLADELVCRQNVGRQRIHLVVGKRHRLLPRHRSPNVVKNGGCVWPEVGDGFHRRRDVGNRTATDERSGALGAAFPVLTVAQRAFRHIDLGAFSGRAAANGQAGTVWVNDARSTG